MTEFFNHYDVLTGQVTKFAKVIIHNEQMNINGVKFKMDNEYNVPATEINNKKAYIQPLDNPRKNIDKAFAIYRSKMGLLDPKRIKNARKQLQLSQPELACILGMSYSTLSKIENNHVIQSVSQDTELRNLFNATALLHLIEARIPSIKAKRPNKVKIQDLIKTTKLLKKKMNQQNNTNNKRIKLYSALVNLPIKGMLKSYCDAHHLSVRQLMATRHISKTDSDEIIKHSMN